MKIKATTHYWIDAAAFLAGFISATSGIVLNFLPHGGFRSGQISSFLHLQKHAWRAIHIKSSYVFVILIVVHLIVHWRWIGQMTKRIFGHSDSQNSSNE